MRVLITGNPNYQGLCRGIVHTSESFTKCIGRWNGWDINDAESIADYAKDFDIFVNSQYGPDGQQLKILKAVYKKFGTGHIINISSTSSYWNDGSPEDYIKNKKELDEYSQQLGKNICWGDAPIRVTNIAFGQLDSAGKKRKTKNKISLEDAGRIVKWVIDSPTTYNIHYISLDPIQTS